MAEIRLVKSLQRKVAVISSIAIGTALVLGIHGAQMAERAEQHQHLDMHLAEVAQTVFEFTKEEARKAASLNKTLQQHTYLPSSANLDMRFQVWLRDGAVLLQTNDSGSQQALMPLDQAGFATGMVDGLEGRKFSLPSPDGSFVVQVAEQFEDRDNDAPTLLHYYFLPIALPLLFSMLATWTLLRRSADALDALVHRLQHMDLNNLNTVRIDKPTHEILPVIEEVNDLFKRASNAMQTEQRFTAMAAHELRTPWAGIKAQAQLALRARTEDDRQDALRAVIGGVNRASHVFDQLFDLTRLETTGQDLSARFARVQFTEVYQQVMDDLKSKAAVKLMQLSTDFAAPELHGLDFAIYLLLRNLLANAILYGPEGGAVAISTALQDRAFRLCVDDSGPGIPVEARASAFERFNRLNQHGPDGVGLGLSIVLKVVEMHRATIELLDSPLGGLRVQVTFSCGADQTAPPLQERTV
jgi:signal transduction histidine kinase